jgi:sugar lactone lactonase YvrE
MTQRIWWMGAAIALLGTVAWAQAASEGAVTAFRRLRAEAVAAFNAGDMATAAAKLSAADAAVPNYPALVVQRAKVEAAQGHLPAAVALLDRFAHFGLTIDLTGDELLQRIAAQDGFAPVQRRLDENRAPVGALQIVASIDGAYLAEGIAWDAGRNRWLISGVHQRTITAVEGGRAPSRFLEAGADADAVQGLALDVKHGVLWAGSSGLPQARDLPPDHVGRAGLLKIDLASGRVLARYEAPEAPQRAFGDLAMGPDGTVFVSDSLAGEVWRLPAGASTLQRLVPRGILGSPQAMVVTPDGRRLIVADYASGLNVIDLATGAVSPFPTPSDCTLVGTDGLIRDGADLIAFQNGVAPQRIVRLRLDRNFTRVEGWRVLAANLAEIAEPTTGVVLGDDLVFVARSQWAEFGDDGTLRVDPPSPVLIARLRLR